MEEVEEERMKYGKKRGEERRRGREDEETGGLYKQSNSSY